MDTLKSNKEKGFTLIELVISAGISAIVLLGAGTLIVQANRAIKMNQQRQHLVDNILTVNMALLRYMGQAIGIRWHGNNNLDTTSIFPSGASCFNPGSNCGRIRQYSAPATAASLFGGPVPSPPVDTLALFLKESRPNGVLAANQKLSRLTGVGIFYQHQTTQYSGVLWITEVSINGNNLQLRAGDTSPDTGSIFFENVVDVQVMNPDPPNVAIGGLLKSIDIMVRMRAFNGTERQNWRFCPPAEAALAACISNEPFSDVDRTIHLTFRNNVISNPSHMISVNDERFFERVYGSLYFYDFNFPSISRLNSSEGM